MDRNALFSALAALFLLIPTTSFAQFGGGGFGGGGFGGSGADAPRPPVIGEWRDVTTDIGFYRPRECDTRVTFPTPSAGDVALNPALIKSFSTYKSRRQSAYTQNYVEELSVDLSVEDIEVLDYLGLLEFNPIYRYAQNHYDSSIVDGSLIATIVPNQDSNSEAAYSIKNLEYVFSYRDSDGEWKRRRNRLSSGYGATPPTDFAKFEFRCFTQDHLKTVRDYRIEEIEADAHNMNSDLEERVDLIQGTLVKLIINVYQYVEESRDAMVSLYYELMSNQRR